MSKYLKAKLAAIADDPSAMLDADDATFLDGLLARAWRDALAKAGGPGQWPAWYSANVLHGSVPLWVTLEGFAPLESGAIEYGPIFGDGATLASPTAACYSLAVRAGVEDGALSRLPFGQSELAISPHFLDQLAPWQAEELLPAPTSRDAVEELGVESVTPLTFP
jgi:acyl-homoserine lactone acylase PvdQ